LGVAVAPSKSKAGVVKNALILGHVLETIKLFGNSIVL